MRKIFCINSTLLEIYAMKCECFSLKLFVSAIKSQKAKLFMWLYGMYMHIRQKNYAISRLTVVSHEPKEEVPYEGLSMNVCEYFTRTNLVKIQNSVTDKPLGLALNNSR